MDNATGTATFTPEYAAAMNEVYKIRCEHCGAPLLSHAARFVKERCMAKRNAS